MRVACRLSTCHSRSVTPFCAQKLAATPGLHVAKNHPLEAQEDDLAHELRLAHEELSQDRQEAEAKKRKSRGQSRQHLHRQPSEEADSSSPYAIAPQTYVTTQSQAKATSLHQRVSLDDVHPGKVHVTIYMESRCPACRKYTTTYLKQVIEEVGNIVQLRVVPFGNADATSATDEAVKYNTTALLKPLLKQLESPWSNPSHAPQLKFKCQHGSGECMGNAWESCLMEVAPHHEDFFPVFDCVESRGCAAGMKPPDCVDYPAFVADGYSTSFSLWMALCHEGIRDL